MVTRQLDNFSSYNITVTATSGSIEQAIHVALFVAPHLTRAQASARSSALGIPDAAIRSAGDYALRVFPCQGNPVSSEDAAASPKCKPGALTAATSFRDKG